VGTIALEAQPEVRWEANRRLADRFFRGALAVTAAITAVWLYFLLTGRDGGAAFAGRVDLEAAAVTMASANALLCWGLRKPGLLIDERPGLRLVVQLPGGGGPRSQETG